MNFLSYPLNVCFYSSLFVEVLPAASTPPELTNEMRMTEPRLTLVPSAIS